MQAELAWLGRKVTKIFAQDKEGIPYNWDPWKASSSFLVQMMPKRAVKYRP